MLSRNMTIAEFDPELAQAIQNEHTRQEHHIELIASENYCSPRVLEAQGSQLTNKYAEGYPGKRYYGGCEYVDIAEDLAVERAKQLFGADYANVQPHSGSQANTAVFMALLEANDTVLGMSLADGGHLTHGSHVNFSGKTYKAVQYGLNEETGEIDYDQIEALALEHKPKMIIGGFSAYSGIVDWQRFRAIADQVLANAKAMVAVMQERGYKIVSNGTDNHLFLLDLIDKDVTGKDADAALGRANITVNKNSVPKDPRSPFVTSGLRIGTPAITRRGFKQAEAKQVATWICDVLDNMGDESVVERVQGEVVELCNSFPVYAG
jgi:glycine/serine hydroxymethyltransferase